jgi:hypothetical protein
MHIGPEHNTMHMRLSAAAIWEKATHRGLFIHFPGRKPSCYKPHVLLSLVNSSH